ncbi:TPA: hypothetical protein RSW73_000252 [Vibrio cholerae]|nr:hypothetical protein [Vibrio cholerae]
MKVEKQHIENLVSQLEFKFERFESQILTICRSYLHGFPVSIGESSCSPKNYNYENSCILAKERCIDASVNRLWQLEDYLLKVTGHTSDYFNRPEVTVDGGFVAYREKEDRKNKVIAYKIQDLTDIYSEDVGLARIFINEVLVEFSVFDGETIEPGDYVVKYDNQVRHVKMESFESLYHI